LFSDGRINAITIASDRPGGFTGEELGQMYETLPVLSRRFELHAMRHTARTLLDTYLGTYTGERVLNGQVRRDDGEDIHAVIWFCDLRDSTTLAESMSRREFLGVLNDFFDCIAGAVLDHGGEVLRFIGDAALAIFPTGVSSAGVDRGCCTNQQACGRALEAARGAQGRIAALNERRAAEGKPALGFGLGLHMGDVTYGNIGVPGRLEFTVVGAAGNQAARLKALTKTLDRPILISGEFEACHPGELVSLGFHELRGVDGAREVFTLPEAA
jgi:adenylate cyclase